MSFDEIRGVLERSGFATGFFVGSLALAAGVLLVLAWPPSSRTPSSRTHSSRTPSSQRRLVPLAGLLLVGGATLALADQARLADGLAPGLALLALAGASAVATTRLHLPPTVATAVLAVPGAWLVAGATDLEGTGAGLVLVGAIAGGGALVGAAAHYDRHLGLGPVLLLATLAGVYATLPDTERAAIVLGVAVPLAVLGWPWPLASLGRAGASATVGLLAWVAVTDGATRAGSSVGAFACLGVLLVGPVVKMLLAARGQLAEAPAVAAEPGDGPAAWRTALPVVLTHLVLVTVAARIAGFRSSALEAAAISGVALAVAVLVAVRWPALVPPAPASRDKKSTQVG